MTIPSRGDYLGGRFVRPSRRAGVLTSQDPGDTRLLVGRFPFGGEAAVHAAVEAARKAQPAWSRLPLPRRIQALRRVQVEIRRHAETLAVVLTREVGKPLTESREEVRRMLGRLDVTVAEALPDVAGRSFENGKARLVYRPLGVMAILAPFNFPANLLHGQVVPALLTGNTVVAKASDLVPAVAQLYAEIVDAAGLPTGVFNLVQGDGHVGAALTNHVGVDGVLFTGSHHTGRTIERAVGPDKLVALEMGGRNAAIVLPDADLDAAAEAVVASAFATTGQRCSSTSRLLAHRRIAEGLLDRVVERTVRLVVGYGFDPGVFMGPLISAPARTRYLARVRRATTDGLVEPILPGRALARDRPGHYVAPSIHRLRRRDFTHPYLADELFGPDLCVDVIDDLDEGLEQANASAYGLCLAVFTKRRPAFEEVLRRGRAGVVSWNRGTTGGSAHLPFGGLGRSGNFRPGGIHTIRSCVQVVAVQEPGPHTPRRTPRRLDGTRGKRGILRP